MPQEKGWYLHGGDIHELWDRVGRRVEEFVCREAPAPPAPPPAEPEPPAKG